MLREVEWGEYRLGDLFEVCTYKKRFDANKVELLENEGYPYIVRMSSDNGRKGLINEDTAFLNEGNTLSFGQDTATVFYQKNPYFTGDKIKILKCKDIRFGSRNALFFVTAISQAFSQFSWGTSSYSIEIIESQKIQLPIKDNQIDFEFMESFVAELEARRVAELEAYLSVTGLKDYILTKEEEEAYRLYESGKIDFNGYEFETVFNNIQQGRRLKKEDQLTGNIPFVMAGVTNAGVANYISNPVAKFPGNSITIDIFGNTFYRDYSFGAGDDTGVYWNDSVDYDKECMLYFAAAMAKAIAGKYSYGKKLRSSKSLKIQMILPKKEGKPDFVFMKNLISAMQKLVIKDAVLYADKKIEAAKAALSRK